MMNDNNNFCINKQTAKIQTSQTPDSAKLQNSGNDPIDTILESMISSKDIYLTPLDQDNSSGGPVESDFLNTMEIPNFSNYLEEDVDNNIDETSIEKMHIQKRENYINNSPVYVNDRGMPIQHQYSNIDNISRSNDNDATIQFITEGAKINFEEDKMKSDMFLNPVTSNALLSDHLKGLYGNSKYVESCIPEKIIDNSNNDWNNSYSNNSQNHNHVQRNEFSKNAINAGKYKIDKDKIRQNLSKLTGKKNTPAMSSNSVCPSLDDIATPDELSIINDIRQLENELSLRRRAKKSLMTKQRHLKKSGTVPSISDANQVVEMTDSINDLMKQYEHLRKQNKSLIMKYNIKKGSLRSVLPVTKRKSSKSPNLDKNKNKNIENTPTDSNIYKRLDYTQIKTPYTENDIMPVSYSHVNMSSNGNGNNIHVAYGNQNYMQVCEGNEYMENEKFGRNHEPSKMTKPKQFSGNINYVYQQQPKYNQSYVHESNGTNMQPYNCVKYEENQANYQQIVKPFGLEQNFDNSSVVINSNYDDSSSINSMIGNITKNSSRLQNSLKFGEKLTHYPEQDSRSEIIKIQGPSKSNQKLRNVPNKNRSIKKKGSDVSEKSNQAIKQLLNSTVEQKYSVQDSGVQPNSKIPKLDNYNAKYSNYQQTVSANRKQPVNNNDNVHLRRSLSSAPLPIRNDLHCKKNVLLNNQKVFIQQVIIQPKCRRTTYNNDATGTVSQQGNFGWFWTGLVTYNDRYNCVKIENQPIKNVNSIDPQKTGHKNAAAMAAVDVNNFVSMISKMGHISDLNPYNNEELKAKSVTSYASLKTRPTPFIDNTQLHLHINQLASQNTPYFLKSFCDILGLIIPMHYFAKYHICYDISHTERLYVVNIFECSATKNQFCRQCDVLLVEASIKKNLSDLCMKNLCNINDNNVGVANTMYVCFCSSKCYHAFEMSLNSKKIEFIVNDEFQNSDKKLNFIKHEIPVDSEYKYDEQYSKPHYFKITTTRQFLSENFKPKILKSHYIQNDSFNTLKPCSDIIDSRKCLFCLKVGDGNFRTEGRLINVNADKFVHINCAFWSQITKKSIPKIYNNLPKSRDSPSMKIDVEIDRLVDRYCNECTLNYAGIYCAKLQCYKNFHIKCAKNSKGRFYGNGEFFCSEHENPDITTKSISNIGIFERAIANRDEHVQFASVFQQNNAKMAARIGSVVYHKIGVLSYEQILSQKFNNDEYIYPVGFNTSRYFWSFRRPFKKAKYINLIDIVDDEPVFHVSVHEPQLEIINFKSKTPDIWFKIFEYINESRKNSKLLKINCKHLSGHTMFGLTNSAVYRVIESLPGVDNLNNYKFRYGHFPSVTSIVTINPSGCARCEPGIRSQFFRRSQPISRSSILRATPRTYNKQAEAESNQLNSPFYLNDGDFAFDMLLLASSKVKKYRDLKLGWRSNVYLRRSKIQGLGLYAAVDLEKFTMIIEYVGEVIRNEVTEKREQIYEKQNRGIYMFRVDDDSVVDATMCGGPSRYINHSCEPNCSAEIIQIEKDRKIIIISKRAIAMHEELTYDYQFDVEEVKHKIPCGCRSTRCKKWLN
ncbi:putative histone-lysine N-methyltransferase set-23 [Intoshia linei]|uniref:Putative histone-lysine N-methyltransferase set-23 n=1 Tax=Intoshia linei TaxID=1819745 RepID=A0A177B4D3_9BILA|nr:putative histone-lysine N-methyltransferase set-23 [Intoshia linei]